MDWTGLLEHIEDSNLIKLQILVIFWSIRILQFSVSHIPVSPQFLVVSHLEFKYVACLSQPIILLPEPTWGNHNKIFPLGGVAIKPYRYYDPNTRGLDYEGAIGFSMYISLQFA